jgi:hypothetical protein
MTLAELYLLARFEVAIDLIITCHMPTVHHYKYATNHVHNLINEKDKTVYDSTLYSAIVTHVNAPLAL